MQALRVALVGLSLLAAALVLVAGPGTRFGAWDFRIGFDLMRWALYLGLGVAAVAFVMLLIPRTRGPRASLLAAALLMGVAAAAPTLALRNQASGLPPIHDITTDTREPPAFVTLLAVRKASPNGAEYGGPEVAEAQRKAYPNVRPLYLQMAPPQAFARALDVARAMGWEIVAADAASGRIEATATTLWFGFKDDIVVRVVPQGGGSRIDVRSVSRVGKSDIGANARRVLDYLTRLT